MIEVRTFDGDPKSAYEFIHSVWSAAYGGKEPIPVWSPEYFEWALMSQLPKGGDYLIAAYDKGKLVGTLFAEPLTVRLRGEPVSAATGSWLAVPRDRARGSIAKLMYAEMRKRQLQRGVKTMLGFVYLSKQARLGYKFWMQNTNTEAIAKIRWWVRIFDHRAVAQWEPSRALNWATRCLGWVQPPPRDRGPLPNIRAYVPGDFEACKRALEKVSAPLELSVVFSDERLARQLKFKNMSRTLVAEQDSAVAGFLNYYPLALQGKSHLQTAFIDYLAGTDLRPDTQSELVSMALRRMMGDGIAMAMTPHFAGLPWQALVKNGFFPTGPQHLLISTNPEDGYSIGKVRSALIPLR